MDLGKIIRTEFNGNKRSNGYDIIFTDKKKRISLDEKTSLLSYNIGDHVIFIPKEEQILFLIPTLDDEVEKEILTHSSWTPVPMIFRKIILTKTKEYIQQNENNVVLLENKGRSLSMFFNIVAWKSFYYELGGTLLYEIVNKCVKSSIAKLFIHKWLETRLFRQLSLWGLTIAETKECIEQMMIGDRKKYTFEDFMVTIAENPGRFWNLSQEKIKNLEKLFGAAPTPCEIFKLGSDLKKALPHNTYIDFSSDNKLLSIDGIGHEDPLTPKIDLQRYGLSLVENGSARKISFSHIRQMESFVSDHLARKIRRCDYSWISKPFLFSHDEDLSYEQKEAVKMVFCNPLSIITGGPGTGKTRVIRTIIEECLRRQIAYHVTAFTGKAVTRVRETTAPLAISSSTIDLMITKGSLSYDFQLLIIEEASMLTTKNLYRLFREFPPIQYSIVFVGDLNQIPPIEWGHIFYSLIWSQKVPYKRLTFNYRVDCSVGKEIIINSEKIIDPFRPINVPIRLELNSDSFNLIEGNRQLVTVILERMGKKSDEVTLLSPYNSEVEYFNRVFQQILFSPADLHFSDKNKKEWYVGDKVMLKKNLTAIDLMNGDIGIVTDINHNKITVNFSSSDREQKFSLISSDDTDLPVSTHLDHAYSLTINKSQGSEYSTVILYIPSRDSNDFFLNQNLIYTAITRAKKMLWIICEKANDFFKGCNKRLPASRDSVLLDLKNFFPEKIYLDENDDIVIPDPVLSFGQPGAVVGGGHSTLSDINDFDLYGYSDSDLEV